MVILLLCSTLIHISLFFFCFFFVTLHIAIIKFQSQMGIENVFVLCILSSFKLLSISNISSFKTTVPWIKWTSFPELHSILFSFITIVFRYLQCNLHLSFYYRIPMKVSCENIFSIMDITQVRFENVLQSHPSLHLMYRTDIPDWQLNCIVTKPGGTVLVQALQYIVDKFQ